MSPEALAKIANSACGAMEVDGCLFVSDLDDGAAACREEGEQDLRQFEFDHVGYIFLEVPARVPVDNLATVDADGYRDSFSKVELRAGGKGNCEVVLLLDDGKVGF